MIRLQKLRLIQWHSFRDVTIPIGERTLFVGENGSGKSTIIDAIQYALVTQLHKIRFNAAAAEKRSGRNLQGYILAKTGFEGEEYQRTEGISHVILEFSRSDGVFCAGICAELTKDSTQIKELPWIAKDVHVQDVPVFLDSTHLLGAQQFKQRMKDQGAEVFESKRAYQNELTNLLGVYRRNVEFNPYLDALVRSIGFTPMDSVDRFVCDYILEERMVDISVMKSNLQSYKDAEAEAELTIKNIAHLEEILAKARVWQQHFRTILNQDYLKRRLESELAKEAILTHKKRSQNIEAEIAVKTQELHQLKEEVERLREEAHQIDIAIRTNQSYQLIQELEYRRGTIQKELEQAHLTKDRYRTLQAQIEALLNQPLIKDREGNVDITRSYEELETEQERLYQGLIKSRDALDEFRKTLSDIAKELEELERGLVRYPEGPAELVKALQAADIQAWIFSDLVEVSDGAWQNALEGWLNTQRFAVLVAPEQFQRAIEVYDSLPHQIGGVPLPNLAKMSRAEVRPLSLAELIITDSPYARRYADYILGRVIRTDKEHLKDFDQSVTQSCLTYSGYTVNRLRESLYSRWYLGKRGREQHRENLILTRKNLQEQIQQLEISITLMEQRSEVLKRALPSLTEMNYMEKTIAGIPSLEDQLNQISEQIKRVDTSDLEVLRNEHHKLLSFLRLKETQIEKTQNELGQLQGTVKTLAEKMPQLETDMETKERHLKAFVEAHEQYREEFEDYYTERVQSREAREQILANYEGSLQGNQIKLQKALEAYQGAIQKYNQVWNSMFSLRVEDSTELEALKKRLEASELPLYREKISRARAMAEQQFKEHFVSRLNEYIEEARESFREINAILRNLTFGKDQYHFTLEERNDRKAQLMVIRKAAEIHENRESLFEALTSDAERQAVDELFNKILKNDLDSFEVRELCDYRTYFTYDIRVRDTSAIDPKTGKVPELSLSRALREKSGGESQTPYYVAIAASIYRYYKDDPEHCIRLAVFDEAFNKMDERRIGVTLDLYERLGMQLITAVPSEKLEIIQPYMDTVNLVLRYGNESWVRDYRAVSSTGNQ